MHPLSQNGRLISGTWIHNGSPIKPSSQLIVFLNGTLQVTDGVESNSGFYQCCSGSTCSVPVCAQLLDTTPFLVESARGDFFWIYNSSPSGFYTFREPATELECHFALSKQLFDLRVKWTYGLPDDMDSGHDYQSSVNFPTHNLSFPCSQDYLFLKGFNCYRFTLVLKRQPQKTITCHVYARTVYESRSFQPLLQQPGNPKRSFFSDTEFDEDELLDEENEEDWEILREIASLIKPPNITVSSIECGDVVNVTCTVPEESVELYITSHSFDLERCNGSWADLPSNGLSLLNFSVDESMDTFIAKASIRQTGGGDHYVVCRYLEKYAFRHLQIPKCSTPDSSRYLALAQQIGVIVVCQLVITSLLALTLWCCCSWRCSRRKRHSTAAMIYHRNETPPTNFQNSYSYAAAIGFLIYTELTHSSKSGDSFLRKIESLQHCSAEDYLEPREIRESHLHTRHLPRMLRPSRQRRYPRRLPVKANEWLFVPLSCLRRSVVYFRLLRQIKALLQHCTRMPKSAKLLLLCQKQRAKAMNQSRWHISRSFDYKVK